jgi:hypothetical protein
MATNSGGGFQATWAKKAAKQQYNREKRIEIARLSAIKK